MSDVRTAKPSVLPPDGVEPDVVRQPQAEVVLGIRIADRLHNMRTVKFVPMAEQQGKARETRGARSACTVTKRPRRNRVSGPPPLCGVLSGG